MGCISDAMTSFVSSQRGYGMDVVRMQPIVATDPPQTGQAVFRYAAITRYPDWSRILRDMKIPKICVYQIPKRSIPRLLAACTVSGSNLLEGEDKVRVLTHELEHLLTVANI